LNEPPFSSELLTIAPPCLSSKSMPMDKASMEESREAMAQEHIAGELEEGEDP
jgi:hypothetical protein